jgi:twinkle protein
MTIPRQEVEDFTDSDLREIYAKVEDVDVIGIEEFSDSFIERLSENPVTSGIALPWFETEDKVRLRMGEVSLIAGINGHMKSTVLSQILLWAAKDQPVGLASFEMDIEDTAKLMCKQSAAIDNVAPEYGKKFAAWLSGRFYWYRVLGGVSPIQCLGAIVAMARRGAKVIAIDNLQFTGVTEDNERERLWFNQIIGLASAMKIHICILHHVRKPQHGGDEYVPTRFDVRGSSSLVDQVHLLMIAWHNKRRSRILQKQEYGQPLDSRETDILQNECDFRLIVAKQRKAPFEGSIPLYLAPGQAFKFRKTGKPPTMEWIG